MKGLVLVLKTETSENSKTGLELALKNGKTCL